jgi:thiaminase
VTKAYVYVCSDDSCWQGIVKKTEDDFLVVDVGPWTTKSTAQLDHAVKAKARSLVLIDICQQLDIRDAVQSLRNQGWNYVVVVARNRSAIEAHEVLYGNLGYDYWKKTYVVSEIRACIQTCLDEINDNYSIKRSENEVAPIRTDCPRREFSQ